MEPTLREGAIVIARKKQPNLNDIIIARVKGREVIKRITSLSDQDVFIEGDNKSISTDSREYGTIQITDILGVVIKTFNR
jgi:phage repressor protein C with HTH and peptisase S24 domain